jgi:hypothetical protein
VRRICGCGLLLLNLGVLGRFVMANRATGSSTEHGMMTCNMASHAANCSTLEATVGFSSCRDGNEQCANNHQ